MIVRSYPDSCWSLCTTVPPLHRTCTQVSSQVSCPYSFALIRCTNAEPRKSSTTRTAAYLLLNCRNCRARCQGKSGTNRSRLPSCKPVTAVSAMPYFAWQPRKLQPRSSKTAVAIDGRPGKSVRVVLIECPPLTHIAHTLTQTLPPRSCVRAQRHDCAHLEWRLDLFSVQAKICSSRDKHPLLEF